ncbi:MAG: FkbM family methyltransferase [bacterium]|nr:FkbM family methyltransferase [bacterium]
MGSPPFGHYVLSPWREKLRLLAGGSRQGTVRRIFASTARRVSLFAHPDPFDIEVFADQRARLYPRDNLCEKRVYARPDSWDHEERARISQIIREFDGNKSLVFVDAGANVGLYSLYVLSEAKAAGRKVRVLAIEPDPINRQRLSFNIEASNAVDEVTIIDKAIGDSSRNGHLVFAGGNRGEIRLATKKELGGSEGLMEANSDSFVKVEIVPLLNLLEDQNLDHVDMLKIDIEGGEADVFKAFFEDAERSRLPRWIILETISQTGEAALAACLAAGYEVSLQTKMNAVLEYQKKQDG